MRVLLDSNILLRLSQPDHPHHGLALVSLDLLRHRGSSLHIVPQNLYEYWVVATRSKAENGLGFSPEQATKELSQIRELFALLRDERTIYAHWQQLVSQHAVRGKQAHDARLVAAMQRHGLTHLLTFNASDFERYPAIHVINPNDV
jgi:predicted nucleic acid-binding protein